MSEPLQRLCCHTMNVVLAETPPRFTGM